MDGLAYRYLVELKCPRTWKESVYDANKKNYMMTDLESRFSYLRDYAKDWRANGVVLEVMRYCDSYGYELPGVKDYLNSIGLPSISLELDYSEAALTPMRTRVQGLLEVTG